MSSPELNKQGEPRLAVESGPGSVSKATVWINAVGVTVLVATELFMLSASLDWAVAGLFGLGNNVAYGLLAFLMIASAYASVTLLRRAVIAERNIAAATANPSNPAA